MITWAWFFLNIGLLITNLIVNSSFIWIWKTSHCRIYLFKCLSRIRRWIFIWMHFDSFAFKCFLKINFSTISLYFQDLVVIFTSYNLLANQYIFIFVWPLILWLNLTILSRRRFLLWLGGLLWFFLNFRIRALWFKIFQSW